MDATEEAVCTRLVACPVICDGDDPPVSGSTVGWFPLVFPGANGSLPEVRKKLAYIGASPFTVMNTAKAASKRNDIYPVWFI